MTFLRLYLTCIFLLVLKVSSAQYSETPPNILFIITDDLNCNLGAYNHYLVKTPNIDRLAEKGVVFENAFCNFPLCGPSRASMMTGLYPDQTGHYRLNEYIRDHVPEVVTLTQNFMRAGYTSARVGKIYHYNNPNGIGTPGHDDSLSWHIRKYPKGRDKQEEDKIFSLKPGRFGATLSWMAAEGSDEEQTDGMVATESIQLMQQFSQEKKPFFLAVGFYKPHTPFVAPKKYFDLYPRQDIKIPEIPANYLTTLPEPAVKQITRFSEQNNLPDSMARAAIQAYYATISFMDAQVGRLLAALEKYDLHKNTIIVFTSDHGYHMGEQGYYQKKTLFENSGRIPLIISVPGIKNNGQRTTSIMEMIDLYPTLNELAGLSGPPYLAGRSLMPVLNDLNMEVRTSALTQISQGYTIRTRNYRYTRYGEVNSGHYELYDRRNDPEELHNLANDYKYQSLMKDLEQRLAIRIMSANQQPDGLKVIK